MLNKILVLTLFLFSALNQIQTTDCVFISSGVYESYVKYGVNLPTCGLSFVGQTFNISFMSKCFAKTVGNITIVERSDGYTIYNSAQVSSRIFNGRDAVKGESPWTVLIVFYGKIKDDAHDAANIGASGLPNTKVVYCTGSLLTFRWVLTSAKCVNSDTVKVDVVAGADYRKQSVPLGNLFKHPGYVGANWQESIEDIKHDIGLIKLDNDYDLVKDELKFYLNTICLPNDVLETDEREMATISGWGAINETVPKSTKLQISEIRIKPGELCNNRMLLCAEFYGDDPRPCEGDTGGPLYQFTNEAIPKAIQIGVYRGGGYRGVGSCKSGHTRKLWSPPMRFIDWILNTIKDNN